MADFSELQASQPVKIAGAQSDGVETGFVSEYANALCASDLVSSGGGVQGSILVGTTATEAKAGASRLNNRKLLLVQPLDGRVYLGFSSAVTTSSGILVLKKQVFHVSIDDSTPVFLISSSSVNVRVAEV